MTIAGKDERDAAPVASSTRGDRKSRIDRDAGVHFVGSGRHNNRAYVTDG
jgi:hypothetical protein